MKRKTKRFPVTARLSREDIIDVIREGLAYFEDDKVVYEFLDHCYNRGLLNRSVVFSTLPFFGASHFTRWKTETLVKACEELIDAKSICNEGYYDYPGTYLTKNVEF